MLITQFQLQVSQYDGKVEFFFPDGPVAFVMLTVVSPDGEELWRIRPIGMARVPAAAGGGAFITVDPAGEGADTLRKLLPDDDAKPQFPKHTHVVYGDEPEGYAQAGPAAQLARGGSYSVIVMTARSFGTQEFTMRS